MSTKVSYPRKEAGQVEYANAAAVTVGDVIFIPGVGVAVAAGTYGATVSGVYYTDGIFEFPIASGVTVTQGTRCYWDVSEEEVITTGMVAGDFELGRAIAAGSAAGGYVQVRVGASAIDGRSAEGLTAAKIAALVGTHVAVATTGVLETVTNAAIATTDTIFAQISSVVATGGTITKVTAGTGLFTVSLTSQVAAAPIAYQVFKA
jgi:predicted RecA/RadA family phage recombinase